jgi:hypothetical protein
MSSYLTTDALVSKLRVSLDSFGRGCVVITEVLDNGDTTSWRANLRLEEGAIRISPAEGRYTADIPIGSLTRVIQVSAKATRRSRSAERPSEIDTTREPGILLSAGPAAALNRAVADIRAEPTRAPANVRTEPAHAQDDVRESLRLINENVASLAAFVTNMSADIERLRRSSSVTSHASVATRFVDIDPLAYLSQESLLKAVDGDMMITINLSLANALQRSAFKSDKMYMRKRGEEMQLLVQRFFLHVCNLKGQLSPEAFTDLFGDVLGFSRIICRNLDMLLLDTQMREHNPDVLERQAAAHTHVLAKCAVDKVPDYMDAVNKYAAELAKRAQAGAIASAVSATSAASFRPPPRKG